MNNYLIAPSILSANFAKLGEDVKNVLEAGADIIHFDVMDNHYVPNLSFGPIVCEALRNDGITADIDVHLMISPVDSMIEAFAKAGATNITIHPEATEHVDRSLSLIRDLGCKAGLALNPATGIHHLKYVIDKVDLVLVMLVNPGFGGQKFIPSTIQKIRDIRNLLKLYPQEIRLEVDGGVKVDNIAQFASAGADTFVAGSAIFESDDYAGTIRKMRKALA